MIPARTVPENRHVVGMIVEAEAANEGARHLCRAAGHDPERRTFVDLRHRTTVPMWLGFVGQAYGFINLRAGRPAQL